MAKIIPGSEMKFLFNFPGKNRGWITASGAAGTFGMGWHVSRHHGSTIEGPSVPYYGRDSQEASGGSWFQGGSWNICRWRGHVSRHHGGAVEGPFLLLSTYAQRNFFKIFLNQTRNQIVFTIIRLIWIQTHNIRLLFQINRKMVNTIW